MKIVLNQDIKGLGKKLSVVEVSEGYARNYLLPKKLAIVADNKSVNEANNKKEAIQYKKDTDKEKAIELKKILELGYIEFKCKVGKNGKLFGSVTEKEICEQIKEKFNIDIDKKKILVDSAIKELGNYSVKIKLYEGVVAKLKIIVHEL